MINHISFRIAKTQKESFFEGKFNPDVHYVGVRRNVTEQQDMLPRTV